jgi:hypothetical protein
VSLIPHNQIEAFLTVTQAQRSDDTLARMDCWSRGRKQPNFPALRTKIQQTMEGSQELSTCALCQLGLQENVWANFIEYDWLEESCSQGCETCVHFLAVVDHFKIEQPSISSVCINSFAPCLWYFTKIPTGLVEIDDRDFGGYFIDVFTNKSQHSVRSVIRQGPRYISGK